jgi:predicted permease
MTSMLRRLRARIRYRHFTTELEQELDAHRAMLEEQARSAGASADEARYEAARQLGNTTLARESARGVWIAPWLESLWQDVRYGVRGLKANPAFTVPALAVLIITMGLVTSLYATVESLLFRPWPLPDADRVIALVTTRSLGSGGTLYATSFAEYAYLRDHAQSMDVVAMTTESRRLGTTPDGEDPPGVHVVSGNYFDVLKIPMLAGRPLHASDDTPGGDASVVVISEGLWKRQLGGTLDAVGSVLRIDDVPFTVVGIAAAGASHGLWTSEPEAWIPLRAKAVLPLAFGELPAPRFFDEPRACCVQMAARLAPGSDRRAADVEGKRLAAQFAIEHTVTPVEISATSTAYLEHPMASQQIRIFTLASVAVGLIVLLGCANVGNLQLARGVSRRREVAVRLALGATRLRLIRQLLIEGLALATIAAGCSLIAAWYLLPLLLDRLDPASTRLVTVGGRTLLFAFVLAFVVCLLSGTLPALQSTRITVGGRGIGLNPSRLRASLLGLQVAISIVVLAAAALLARGLHHATGEALGFNPYGVVSVSLGLPPNANTVADRRQVASELMDLAAQSNLGPIGGARFPPFTAFIASRDVRLEGQDPLDFPYPSKQAVTPGYFDVLGIPLVSGRLFDEQASLHDVVVNEALARRLWPAQPAIGRTFLDNERDEGDREKRVIGVVADANTTRFDRRMPAYYERASGFLSVVIRNDPAAVARLRDIIRTVAPAASPEVRDLIPGLREQIEPALLGTATALGIGLLALLLATVGTLGVFAYVVTERTQEIGVRMTLGAGAREIIGMLGARLSWPLAGGLASGLLAAQGLGVILENQLYGISPRDPLAYLAVLIVLAAAAILAAFIPARRALRLDPAVTLRAE